MMTFLPGGQRYQAKGLLFVFAIFFAFGRLCLAAEPSVEEVRQPDGNSRITVKATDGRELAVYTIGLSKHHAPATSADDPGVKRLQELKYGAFLCFNSNQFSGTQYCSSKDPVKDFRPTALDVQQWISTLKKAGMTHAVLTVRHTSEFLLWDIHPCTLARSPVPSE